MKMVLVASSNVDSVGHEGETIHVRYKTGVLYAGTCTAVKHAEIMASPSIGKALNASGIKLTRVEVAGE